MQDSFTAEPSAPAFMFPLYVGMGKFAATSGIPLEALQRVVETLARTLLVLSLWRFCRRFTFSPSAARAAFLLALFGTGFSLLATLVGAAVGMQQPFAGTWSYETTTFGLLFSAPHVPLALAATLELAGWLAPGRPRTASPVGLLTAVALGAALALLHPFHVPVLLAALVVAGVVWLRVGQGGATLAVAAATLLGALPALVPTVTTFTFDPFWSATYTLQNALPSPLPHELLVDLGVTLLLALFGGWRYGTRVAPFGLLLWVLLAATALYLPVPYQRRLAFGLQPALAVVAGNTLAIIMASFPERAAALRIATIVLAGLTTASVTAAVLASSVTGGPLGIYRSTPDLDRASAWLGQQVGAGETILADWETSNYLAARTAGRVIGGHPVATLRPGDKRFLQATYFAHGGDLVLARQLGARWVVFGPAQAALQGPPVQPVFQSGAVRVYRVDDSA
ncbi:MAG: hypothetical protein HYX52_03250 [Chloroflexi bacterium]|nr:hypothetical protein [Chloroflexota bacterium]